LKEKFLYICTSFLSKIINGAKTVDNLNVRKILIVKLDDIGDMVYALHVFQLLHERFPEAGITVQAKPVNHIFFRYIPFVTLISSSEKIPRDSYDLMFDLRGNTQSMRFAFSNSIKLYFDRGTIRLRNKYQGQKHEVYTNFDIIQPVLGDTAFKFPEITTSPEEKKTVATWSKDNGIERYFIVHAGANSALRRWPAERFAEISDYIQETKNCKVIYVGGSSDLEISKHINTISKKPCPIAAGVFNLLEFSELCNLAIGFLGNESGPMHIASASGTPIVGLFGPGVKDVFYPYSDKTQIIHHFPPNGVQKTGLAMSTITTEEVKAALDLLAI
jgi:ADP-heptose:LPS heptosyltransferase